MDQLEEALGADDSFDCVVASEVEVTLLRSSTVISVPILWASLLGAAELSNYRGFHLGTKLEAAAKQAGVHLSEVRLVHQRPAVIQELESRPRFPYKADATQMDPVRDSLLRFYNGELFQIVTTYDRDKVKGMAEADMVDAISLTYGTATRPAVEIPYHSNYGEAASVLARWEDSEYSYNLIRTGDQASFALIVNCKRLDALAQAAIVEAVRLDAIEAPQRQIDLQKSQEAKDRLVLDKARSENMPNFRP
ncbi:MAG: hypothetical protein ACRD7E_27475 [Bryobacteraceae bacterium]